MTTRPLGWFSPASDKRARAIAQWRELSFELASEQAALVDGASNMFFFASDARDPLVARLASAGLQTHHVDAVFELAATSSCSSGALSPSAQTMLDKHLFSALSDSSSRVDLREQAPARASTAALSDGASSLQAATSMQHSLDGDGFDMALDRGKVSVPSDVDELASSSASDINELASDEHASSNADMSAADMSASVLSPRRRALAPPAAASSSSRGAPPFKLVAPSSVNWLAVLQNQRALSATKFTSSHTPHGEVVVRQIGPEHGQIAAVMVVGAQPDHGL